MSSPAPGAARRGWPWFAVVMWLAGGLLLAFIVLPVLRLAVAAPPSGLRQAAATAGVRDATLLSLQAAAITAAAVILLIVTLSTFLVFRALASGRLVARTGCADS
jgi:ABC-type sulfate transport system permease component